MLVRVPALYICPKTCTNEIRHASSSLVTTQMDETRPEECIVCSQASMLCIQMRSVVDINDFRTLVRVIIICCVKYNYLPVKVIRFRFVLNKLPKGSIVRSNLQLCAKSITQSIPTERTAIIGVLSPRPRACLPTLRALEWRIGVESDDEDVSVEGCREWIEWKAGRQTDRKISPDLSDDPRTDDGSNQINVSLECRRVSECAELNPSFKTRSYWAAATHMQLACNSESSIYSKL